MLPVRLESRKAVISIYGNHVTICPKVSNKSVTSYSIKNERLFKEDVSNKRYYPESRQAFVMLCNLSRFKGRIADKSPDLSESHLIDINQIGQYYIEFKSTIDNVLHDEILQIFQSVRLISAEEIARSSHNRDCLVQNQGLSA